MFKTFWMSALATSILAIPAFADPDIEYPAGRPNISIHRSTRTGRVVVIPPYRHLFQVRVFTTPQRDPYYNVPPYAVISPY